MSLDHVDKARASKLPDQLHPDAGRWGKTLSSQDTEEGKVFFLCDPLQYMTT